MFVEQKRPINIVIPASGKGSRFQEAGYTLPKPLLSIYGKPMIQKVVENISFPADWDVTYIFMVLKEHYDQYQLNYLLPLICKPHKCNIIVVDKVTEGAACTVLLAKDLLLLDQEMLVANSDQLMEWVPWHFVDFMRRRKADGGIATFVATESKWSFAKVNEADNSVSEVAEKNPISHWATTGLYYFKTASLFIKAAEQMINKNIRTRNEFYLCPTFNEIIGDGGKVYSYPVAKMDGTGTPVDFQDYLRKVADGTAF